MKSERRHELQTNSLADALAHTPQFLREHGSKILLGIIILLLVTILIYQRTRRSAEELDIGWTNIATARASIQRLDFLPQMVEDESEIVTARKQLSDNAIQALAPLLASSNRQIAAEAYLLRGDLNWSLANAPAPASAATQPAQQLSAEDYLNRAAEAYEKVIRVYSDLSLTVTNARFGLAAVAENRRDFEAARKLYDDIANDPATTPSYRNLATIRASVLDDISKPIYLEAAATPATAPATLPAIEADGAPLLAPQAPPIPEPLLQQPN